MKKRQVAIFAMALSGMLVVSCKKEQPLTISQGTPESSKLRGPLPQPQNQAFLAEGTLNGACSGGPIIQYSSSLWQFDAPTGNNQLLELQNCNIIASAFNSSNGLMYLATRNTTNGISELHAYNLTSGALTYITALSYQSAIFYVNEMEFDAYGNLYLLKVGDDRNLYHFNLSNNSLTKVNGTMFGVHIGTYREALCYNKLTSELKLIYEIPAASGAVTRVATINTGNAALSAVTTHAIPGVNTFNISGYYDNGSVYFIRDNGQGSATLYNSVGTVLNSMSCRNTHDATWQSAVADPL